MLIKYIGIDVGYTGAIACISNNIPEVFDMPVVKADGKSKLDLPRLYDILQNLNIDGVSYIFVEQQQPMPQQGAVSGFTLGYQQGVLEGFLSAFKFPFQRIRPKVWQKSFGAPVKDKQAAYKVASGLFPGVELSTPRGRILDGRCDALLIAEYCWRINGGGVK